MRFVRHAAGVFLLVAFALTIPSVSKDVAERAATCEGERYPYLVFAHHGRAPAVLLLHGAGGTPEPMIDAWKKTAKAEGLTLIAPLIPRDEKFEPKAPAVFRCIVEDEERVADIDDSRVFVFGYSMGGYLAFDAVTFDSEHYAGAAIYANGIADDYASILDHARRKIPIALYVGEEDRVYPIAQVRKTKAMLEQRGYALRYRELPHQDHNYFATADAVNADAWKFWAEHPATAAPAGTR